MNIKDLYNIRDRFNINTNELEKSNINFDKRVSTEIDAMKQFIN